MKKTAKHLLVSLLFLVFSVSQTSFAFAEVINLAPQATYTSSPQAHAPYEDNGTKLIDEQLAQLLPTDPNWVGYGFDNPELRFTLETPAQLSEIRTHFLNYPSWGIHLPSTVEIQTSLNNQDWTSQGNLTLQQSPEGMFSMQFDNASLDAQYIKIIIQRQYWAFISEVEIFGEPIAPEPTPLKNILFLTSSLDDNNESYNRMINTLDGLGFPYDSISDENITSTNFSDYQLVIVDGTSFELLDINLQEEQHIVSSIQQGVNYLWIGAGIWGSFQTTNLPEAFGLQYVSENTSLNLGVTEAEFTDLAGNLSKFPVYNEYIRIVNPTQATTEGWYYKNGTKEDFPFITKHTGQNQGTAVYISLPILDFWKSTEAEYTYARTELLTKYIQQLTTQGYVGIHPAKYGKEGAFLVRLEDYTPGGTFIDHSIPSWLNRMEETLAFSQQKQVPINIALIPIYAHPYLGEQYTWSDTNQQIPLLKQYAQEAAALGGSLVVHGYKHQNGAAEDDYSGDDWEMWDEDTQEYLPFSEQQEITNNAFAESATQFDYTPTIWETPHYTSNTDTYLAAANSGFKYFTESDTKLFPNYRGYLNKSNGNLLNIPETAFDFPEDAISIAQLEPIKKDHILPRLIRLHAPYYIFYHNNLDAQLNSLKAITDKAKTHDLWYPSLEEYGDFWKEKEHVTLTTLHNPESKTITATVQNSFDGLTLGIRMPNNIQPTQVLINGTLQNAKQEMVDGVLYVYPVLPAQNVASVEISYASTNSVTVANGPIAHWAFNENVGNEAFDSSGNNNTGVLTNMDTTQSWVLGKNETALSFDGSDDIVIVNPSSSINNLDTLSIAFWFNANNLGETSKAKILNKNKAFDIHFSNTSSRIFVNMLRWSTPGKWRITNPTSLLQGWHHFTATYNYASPNTLKTYIDGIEVLPQQLQAPSGSIQEDNSSLTIGNNLATTRTFNGIIDDIRIYDRVLTPQEVVALAL